MSEPWYCVRSVVTDGSGHSVVDTDVMPVSDLKWTLANLQAMYNGRYAYGLVGEASARWTFEQWLTDGRRVTDMIIASPIG